MLAYAQGRQRIGERGSSPSTMLFIIGVHVAVVAVAMSVKMVIDPPAAKPPIEVDLIKIRTPPPPPPPPERQHQQPSKPMQSTLDQPPVIVPTRRSSGEVIDTTPTPVVPIGTMAANNIAIPQFPPVRPIIAEPVRTGPRLNTPESALKPPYPASKLDRQEEASLRLKLSIDERGRVVAVESVGANDRAFFEAARKHLIARWRYQPATLDGNPVASSTVITLTFQLEG